MSNDPVTTKDLDAFRAEIESFRKELKLFDAKLEEAQREIAGWYGQVVSVVHAQSKMLDAHKSIEMAEQALEAIKKRWPPRESKQ